MKRGAELNIDDVRHSLAHLLAAAVLKKFPKAKLGVGPVIEDGFYYDFKLPRSISDEDLPELEKTMRGLVERGLDFKGKEVKPAEAKKIFKDQPYKLELIDDFVKEKKKLTSYKTGDIFTDLCRGGHVDNTKEIDPGSFKLTKVAGAYWRGDSSKDQLQRIYGVAFSNKKELSEYLKRLEEAQKRDHKVLGPKLGLFMFHETAPGMPYWMPKGLVVLNELIDFWRKEHRKRGYHEISTPLINKKELWEASGHWEHYKEDMFIADMGENEVYGVKAMNCPNAMIVFGSEMRSYKDLPLRFSDTDVLHRYELSGTLNGLLRVRSFRQDDSHNFITEDQIGDEYEAILEIADKFYSIFGLKYKLRLGTRPEKFMGDVKTWNKAEKALKNLLDKKVGKKKYEITEGDGAFYGPKVDIVMKDVLGREWQMGTIQLDFQQPKRFKLSYIDEKGKKKTPIVVHRVIYGALERFIGILIEHYAGHFPLWLSPVQVKILPIGEAHKKYAAEIYERLEEEGIRAEVDKSDETLGKKIRGAELEKVSYIVIVGDKEMKNKSVNIRQFKERVGGEMTIPDFIKQLQKEIEAHQ